MSRSARLVWFAILTAGITMGAQTARDTGPPGGAFDGPAQLPRTYVETKLSSTPSSRGRIRVCAAGPPSCQESDLETALAHAKCGWRIELKAGETFRAKNVYGFVLPAFACDDSNWIVITSDGKLPAEGSRLTITDREQLAKLRGPSPRSTVITARTGVNHYRFIGLDIGSDNDQPAEDSPNLIELGSDARRPLPDHIIFDRVFVHGSPFGGAARGFYAAADHFAVIDSWVSDIHSMHRQAQAIYNPFAAGPQKIVNNFLQSAAGTYGSGCGGPCPFDANISDIEFRRNHVYWPPAWHSNDKNFQGQAWNTVVHFETKNASRVLIEGNVFQNQWVDDALGVNQTTSGMIEFWGCAEPCGGSYTNPSAAASNFTIRFNHFINGGYGIVKWVGTGCTSSSGTCAQQPGNPVDSKNRVFGLSIHDNLGEGLGGPFLYALQSCRDVLISHNTDLDAPWGVINIYLVGDHSCPNLVWKDNLLHFGAYGFSGAGSGEAAISKLAGGSGTCNAKNDPCTFTHNVLVGMHDQAFPSNNCGKASCYPDNWKDVGMVSTTPAGDHRLCKGKGEPAASCKGASRYVGRSSDSPPRDLGADMNELNFKIQGVAHGLPSMTINAVTPMQCSAGKCLTITGTGFTEDAQVMIGGLPKRATGKVCKRVSQTATKLECVLPPLDVERGESVNVTVGQWGEFVTSPRAWKVP